MPILKSIALILVGVLPFTVAFGCSTDASRNGGNSNQTASKTTEIQSINNDPGNVSKGATIQIDPNGPADTVRVFYKLLRERKFREAIFLTNLRPAIEGLTESELKDFQVDFEAIAGEVPLELKINGEIISGRLATVTANLPDEESEVNKVQTIKLRRQNGVWIILSADENAEKRIKQDGKKYLNNLRIQTHEDEARRMLDRISKAEIAYSLQNGGDYADISELVAGGLLPDDVQSSASTGYTYAIEVAADKKKYSATATPATYGKSGRLSFVVVLDSKSIAHLNSSDNSGKPLSK